MKTPKPERGFCGVSPAGALDRDTFRRDRSGAEYAIGLVTGIGARASLSSGWSVVPAAIVAEVAGVAQLAIAAPAPPKVQAKPAPRVIEGGIRGVVRF